MFKPDAVGFLSVLFFVMIVAGQRVLGLLLGLVLITLFVARRWSTWALRRVTYERRLDLDRAFVGDTVTMTFRVNNPKLLGVPSLHCHDLVPSRLQYNRQVRPAAQPNAAFIERAIAVAPYEAVSWRVEIKCPVRGLHTFGPVDLTASDPFGLYDATISVPDLTRLIVYPQLVSLPDFNLLPRQPQGDRRAARQLLTDPARTVGVRDYQPTDPFKTIHWTATARRGALQTRVFEPTSTLDLVIVLDLDTFEQFWQGVRPDLVEYLISVAATVATAADAGRWSFGLYANAGAIDSDQLVRLAPSRNPGQLSAVLEALGRIVPYSVVSLPQLLRRITPLFPWGATVVVISAVPSQEVRASLLRLSERGRKVRWLYGGDGELPIVPGVDVEALPFDAAWQASRSSVISAG